MIIQALKGKYEEALTLLTGLLEDKKYFKGGLKRYEYFQRNLGYLEQYTLEMVHTNSKNLPKVKQTLAKVFRSATLGLTYRVHKKIKLATMEKLLEILSQVIEMS
jgi:hypothetical protein